MSGQSATPSSKARPDAAPDPGSAAFPKDARVLKPGDFRRIYDNGVRVTCSYFAAFCLREVNGDRPRFGFTVSRAQGKAVVRNRMRRRLREAVRLEQRQFELGSQVVFNPRKPVLTATIDELRREVCRAADRFANNTATKPKPAAERKQPQ